MYRAADLAPGEHITFAATGVTQGPLLQGVRFFGSGTRTSSLMMQRQPQCIRFIDTIHVTEREDAGPVRIRF